MSNMGRRIAAIDIGTNSVLLTVAETLDGELSVIEQFATVTRLGQDVDRTGTLHPDAVARTLGCLRTYREELDRLRVQGASAVGTSALRDASGGAAFVAEAHKVLGFAPEIISGEREAELTFLGALDGLTAEGRSFVFDIGGGSTELILGHKTNDGAHIERGISLNMGSVRLTERCALSDPPTPRELIAVREEIRRLLAAAEMVVPPGARVVGVAGTVTTLAAISEQMSCYDPTLIHGYSLKTRVVSELVTRLSKMTVAERKQLPGLTPGRADVIVAGAILCEEIAHFAHAEDLLVSDRGVRFGLLAELASVQTD
jgi:exopolyphosphatase/guanosine-5'-triphosphate,3'-diphosphate pyrophosphatase